MNKIIDETIMCYPARYDVKDKKIDFQLMFNQYNNFINFLIDEGVKIHFVDPIYGTSQVYTRDIAFIIEDIMFKCKLARGDRESESNEIDKYIKNNNIRYYTMQNHIEGGDVIVYNDKIFIGLSTRTSLEATIELDEVLKNMGKYYEIIPINFNKEVMLHLDCVFNVLNDESCVISEYVYDNYKIESIFKNVYYLDKETSVELGTNIICVKNKKILSSNKRVTKMLNNNGIKAIYIDYSEFVKGGGSFRCTTLPIYINKGKYNV